MENKRVGVARARCSEDPNFIESYRDYLVSGNDFGVRLENLTKREEDFRVCNHGSDHSTSKYVYPTPNYPTTHTSTNTNYNPSDPHKNEGFLSNFG